MATINIKKAEVIEQEQLQVLEEQRKQKENQLAIESMVVAVREMVPIDSLSVEQIEHILNLYERWLPDVEYKENQILRHGSQLYQVITPGFHTSQLQYSPDMVPSMYAPKGVAGTIGPWEQRDGSNPYMIGDVVEFQNKNYTSKINYNTFSPQVFPDGWAVETAPGVIEEWVQKTYFKGEKVVFEGSTYESIFEGSNVWSPKGYPQGWKLIS